MREIAIADALELSASEIVHNVGTIFFFLHGRLDDQNWNNGNPSLESAFEFLPERVKLIKQAVAIKTRAWQTLGN